MHAHVLYMCMFCTSPCCLLHPEYYLVGWLDEEAVSTVPAKSVVEEDETLVPGTVCHVKSKGKVYKAKAIAAGIILT